ALYWTLLEAVELRHAPWIGWIQNLTAPDPYFILPAINIAVMWATQKLTPTPIADPMQRRMMQYMPVAMGVMFAFFPAGLVLYWGTHGALGLAQQGWRLQTYGDKAPKTAAGGAMVDDTDTIAAIATGAGAAGVGIVRLSGGRSAGIVAALTGREPPPPRQAV